jgi:hypothetical protein
VLRSWQVFLFLLWAVALTAQEGGAPAVVPQTPPVRVNVINVCSPSPEEQKEISDTLARVPRQPLFSEDFEISRGRSTLPDKPGFVQSGESVRFSAEPVIADWVRIRREFSVQATFASVQYSFSRDSQFMVETLVLRVRDPKDVLQVAIENSAANVTDAATMLAAPTPISRVKLERFGKASVVLARCSGDNASGQPTADQSAYAPLFQSASSILTSYRNLLAARHTVPDELARVAGSPTPKPRTAAKPKSPPAKP